MYQNKAVFTRFPNI